MEERPATTTETGNEPDEKEALLGGAVWDLGQVANAPPATAWKSMAGDSLQV